MSLLDKLQSSGDPRPPRRKFAGYELVELVARGPMGEVYRAVEPDTNQVVALKILTERSGRVADRLVKDLSRDWEGERAVGLNHLNVVRAFACGREDDRYFLVMEYLEGSNLAALLVQQSPRLGTHRTSILRQIADGLGYVHRKGIVHRDVCPKNVMVMPNNAAKLIDFGVAIARGDRVSDTGHRTGRPSYMAPELIRSNTFDERTDIYALGVTMYETVTGVRPFIGRNRYEKMQMHLNVEAVPPSEVAGDVSHQLDRVILKSLAKDPDERYRTMDPLLDDLALISG